MFKIHYLINDIMEPDTFLINYLVFSILIDSIKRQNTMSDTTRYLSKFTHKSVYNVTVNFPGIRNLYEFKSRMTY